MIGNISQEYDKKISERILLILKYSSLEIKGIAALTNKSPDIFYAIITRRRRLSPKLASVIGEALDFDGNIIFNLNIPIPTTIKESQKLSTFKKANANNRFFFIDTWTKNKDSTFIREQLLDKGYFAYPRYAWEVNQQLLKLGKRLDSDLLTKQLKYLVEKGLLKSKKAPLKLKEGGYGSRSVTVYFQK
ncbi:hypothetical protein [Sphingobacterium sp. JB170]|uniref:hypothetical protein n=1 Tax=Sphingobacterium sp. JB170 TaxID=1434842 RepID=UPI00097F1CD0|nr:hypothetical protein [Sphingobacterium sp. JB170]SJN47923.1 hypothetical protein FM107_16455 [Sphingobacterium sp. JB170]